jgi:hypothetical protein
MEDLDDDDNDERGMARATVNDQTVFVLNDKFRKSLRQALTGGCETPLPSLTLSAL